MWLTSSTDRKLKSCLSLGRNADSLTPLASAAVVHLAEHKGLHWKPELVAVSAADHRSDSRELQARYRKLETDLQESEAARTMLQKQLHRVQDAMKQNRTHLEDAQRSALAAEEKAAAAEAKAASLSAEVKNLQAELAEARTRLHQEAIDKVCIATPCMTSTEEHKHPYAAASDGDIPSSKASSLNAATNSTLSHGSLPQTHSADSSATVPNPISRKALFPEVQAIPLHGSPAAGLPGTFTAAGHSHAPDLRSFKDWSGNVSSPQLTTAAHAEQQQLAVGLHKPVACSTAGQPATRQAPGNAVGQSAVQTQSVAALQRAAKALPSWAETTFQNSPGTLLDHGFLASAVMLETLGRQKQALSRHATCGSPLQQIKAEISPHTGGSGPGGFSPGSPTSHKYTWLLQKLHASSQDSAPCQKQMCQ